MTSRCPAAHPTESRWTKPTAPTSSWASRRSPHFSNLTSVSGKPLDIVLVMDESYSMRQTDSEESYVEVYADNLL